MPRTSDGDGSDAKASPRRVALIASSFAPHVGGVEEHVGQIARQLHARGHTVEVWTVDRGVRPDAPFAAHDGSEITVRYLPTPLPARSVAAMLRFGLRVAPAWMRWARAHRGFAPEVLHVQCFGPNGIYAERLHRRFGTPLIVSSHGETLGDDHGIYARSALLRARLRTAIAAAAAVTAPSRFALDDLKAHHGLDSAGEIVANGVDLDVVPDALPVSDQPYLYAVGRLGLPKGFDLLIDAYARSGLSRIPLIIGGEGPERDALQRRIDEAGLDERVRLIGRQSPQQVATGMAGALAVIVPSRFESFGIVALEAWRAGTALIMTSRGGAVDFVRHEQNGLLVDPTDVDELAAALIRIVSDDELRVTIARAGHEDVDAFTWARAAEAYERIYDRLR
ncbi:glycosyltransferase family 4 protein [Microbacterium esteraromaticum]|uniref:glycosyltransferase family 4 protein n=1 Tax=Microbacterium esteraromaticum TaxID=57043 RepID=UPI00195A9E55|nr:glycosyltransferase family 4 protein [Microbacterium esteraromaticum]MBM7466716.1 glycosyltransferase involved in cell wall biosynthesis [Microbacterium esteraromaticum]